MKKVLPLLLMLGLCDAGLGYMAIQPVLSGTPDVTEITVGQSEVFYIDLIWLNDLAEGFGPPGELSAADIHVYIDGPASFVDTDNLIYNDDYGQPPYVPLWPAGVFPVISWSGGANPGEMIVGHIGVHCEGPGDVIISTAVSDEVQGGSFVDWAYPLDPASGGPGVDRNAVMIVHQTPPPTCWDITECAGQPSGDVTCDGNINAVDVYQFKIHWLMVWPDPGYNCCADFNHDGHVNTFDLFKLKQNWLTSGWVPATGNQNCPEQ
jgi:hypothetical protein